MAFEVPGGQLPHHHRTPAAPLADAPGVIIRPALVGDMVQVEPLVNHFAARDLMLPKTLVGLSRNFREFHVATDEGGRLLGCAALRVYTPQLAELASLAVAEHAHGLGLGRRLVAAVEADALRHGIGTVFALTLQEPFFRKLGYRTVAKEMFPLKVWADCKGCPKLDACDEVAVVKELD